MNGPDASDNPNREASIAHVLGEYLDRRARGEAVSPEQILAEHPDLADELRQQFHMLDELRPADQNIDGLIAQGVLTRSNDPGYLAELGPYKITGYLGRGGMGIVLRAYEESLNRTVALKLLRPELAGDPTALKRFTREAKAAAALRHPHIVTVYAVGTEHGGHFLAMEYVDGPSLADVIHEHGPLDADTARRCFRELLAGLAAAHDAGLIHRDVKSANVLLDGPQHHVKIADFGLARMLTAQTRLTLADAVLGTAEYMSPEQARGDERIDHRGDLYSAGVVLYEMLTGRTPFRAETPSAVIHRILHEDPPDPRTTTGSADPHLASLAVRLMAKLPEDRFPTAADAIAALDADERIRSLAARRRLRRAALTTLSALLLTVAVLWPAAHFALRTLPITAVRVDPDIPTNIQARYGKDPEWRTFHRFRLEGARICDVKLFDGEHQADTRIVCGLDKAPQGDCLFAFNSDGREVWRYADPLDREWPDCARSAGFRCMGLASVDADGQAGDELVVVASDALEYPTYVAIIDPRTGRVNAQVWHLGTIQQILVVPAFFGAEGPAIVARGNNNKLDGFDKPVVGDARPLTKYDRVSVVMIFDPSNLSGEWLLAPPECTERIELPVVYPYAYAYLDMAPNAEVPDVSSGRERPRWPDPGEVGAVADMKLLSDTNTGGRFVLTVYRELPGKGGTAAVVDQDLELMHTITFPSEAVGLTSEYWRERWHICVSHGQPVGT